jgi:hypothetical protein
MFSRFTLCCSPKAAELVITPSVCPTPDPPAPDPVVADIIIRAPTLTSDPSSDHSSDSESLSTSASLAKEPKK